jgi:hypothetical protein
MNEQMQLRDAFASSDSRTERTALVIDINGSTKMKEAAPDFALWQYAFDGAAPAPA